MSIQYVTGDATQPQGEGRKIIAHGCNDIGGWGSGFVVAVSKRWEHPEALYRFWARNGYWGDDEFTAGNIQLVKAEAGIAVANMITQNGTIGPDNPKPINYEALLDCFAKLAATAKTYDASVHMPRIGCGLAGGRWDVVAALLDATMDDVDVTVYDLP